MFSYARTSVTSLFVITIIFVVCGCQPITAPDDTTSADTENTEGTINVPQVLTESGAPELQLREPSMLEGAATAQVVYDKAANVVAVEARYEGLPYRPTLCYEYDPSTPYYNFPFPCVEDGEWQIWFVADMFNQTSPFYYDADTKTLIGHESELPEVIPSNVISVEYLSLQMVETPGFEPDPETLVADVRFEYDYDNILDQNGTAGTRYAQVRTNLCDAESVIPYWTVGGLPAEQAMHFDDVLSYVEAGNKIMIALSYGPNPKPDYLLARDNIMIGWLGTGPEEVSSWPVSTITETYHQDGFTPTIAQPSFDDIECGS